MITIAAGVCFGILAAVFILNWWQDHLIRRAERRERQAYAKMLRAYEMTAEQRQDQAVDRVVGLLFVAFVVAMIGVPLVNAAMH